MKVLADLTIFVNSQIRNDLQKCQYCWKADGEIVTEQARKFFQTATTFFVDGGGCVFLIYPTKKS